MDKQSRLVSLTYLYLIHPAYCLTQEPFTSQQHIFAKMDESNHLGESASAPESTCNGEHVMMPWFGDSALWSLSGMDGLSFLPEQFPDEDIDALAAELYCSAGDNGTAALPRPALPPLSDESEQTIDMMELDSPANITSGQSTSLPRLQSNATATFIDPRLGYLSLDRPTCVFAKAFDPTTGPSLHGLAWGLDNEGAGQILQMLQHRGEAFEGRETDAQTLEVHLRSDANGSVEIHQLSCDDMQAVDRELDEMIRSSQRLPTIFPLWDNRARFLLEGGIESATSEGNSQVMNWPGMNWPGMNWPGIHDGLLRLYQTRIVDGVPLFHATGAGSGSVGTTPSNPLKVRFFSKSLSATHNKRPQRHARAVYGLVEKPEEVSAAEILRYADIISRHGTELFNLAEDNTTQITDERSVRSLAQTARIDLSARCAANGIHIDPIFHGSRAWESLQTDLTDPRCARPRPTSIPLWRLKQVAMESLPATDQAACIAGGWTPVYDSGKVYRNMEALQRDLLGRATSNGSS